MQKKRIMIVSVICILLLTLCACGTKKQEKKADTVDFSSLSKTGSMELNYATQYSVDEYGGYRISRRMLRFYSSRWIKHIWYPLLSWIW